MVALIVIHFKRLFLLGSPYVDFLLFPPDCYLGGTSGEVDFPNIPARDINASLFVFHSVTKSLAGEGLCGV